MDTKEDEKKCLEIFLQLRDQLINDLIINHDFYFNQDDINPIIYIFDKKENLSIKSTIEFFFFEVSRYHLVLIFNL